jgi:hypothetical protein
MKKIVNLALLLLPLCSQALVNIDFDHRHQLPDGFRAAVQAYADENCRYYGSLVEIKTDVTDRGWVLTFDLMDFNIVVSSGLVLLIEDIDKVTKLKDDLSICAY